MIQINLLSVEERKAPINPTMVSLAEEVFAHWVNVTKKKRAIIGQKRIDLIIRRLKEGFSVAELKRAISGYGSDKWYCGDNDKNRPYLGLELMLRDAAHVERGIELAENPRRFNQAPDATAARIKQLEES